MRKISEDAYNAFISKETFKRSNTEVKIIDGEAQLFLFDRMIAKTENDELFISNGGYRPSNTTRERLNAFPRVHLNVRKSEFIINNRRKWSGEWTNVRDL